MMFRFTVRPSSLGVFPDLLLPFSYNLLLNSDIINKVGGDDPPGRPPRHPVDHTQKDQTINGLD